MPLRKGTSRKTVSKNIKEFSKGPRNKATAKKSGKEAARKQAIAVALKEKRKSSKKKKSAPKNKSSKKKSSADSKPRNLATDKTPKRKAANRRKRNIGRT